MWVWALNDKGLITKCYSPPELRGKGRCNHVFFQNPHEGEMEFVRRVAQRQKAIEDRHKMILPTESSLISTNSKGVQKKFFHDNKFYKGDSIGLQEGLHEEFVSVALDHSNIAHIRYHSCKLQVGRQGLIGCYSDNFLQPDVNEVTMKTLLKRDGLQDMLSHDNIVSSFDAVCDRLESETGLDVRNYLLQTISLDMLVLNHDRHMENITFWQMKDNNYTFAPLFDHGCAFDNKLSDDMVAEKDLSTFLKKGGLYSYKDYMKLLKERMDKPLIKFSESIFTSIEGYENELYPSFYVKQMKKIMIDRLKETEGWLWSLET